MKNTTTTLLDRFDELLMKFFGFSFILLVFGFPVVLVVGLIIHGLVVLVGGMNVLLGISVLLSLIPFGFLLWDVFNS
jgi:hypothetical protein